ncbi:phage Gp37/Gp68 family protein [Nonomuraea basaltis]|nr:phage Gp37/Gp68 family protein [Nonomuraea basaltis]
MGGIAENIAFLSSIHPALTRRCRDFYGKRIETPTSPVVGIRRGPAQRLIDITTSTGTFVAEGALTHNCYALTLAKRLKAMGQPKYQNDGDPRTSGPGFAVTLHPSTLAEPLRWRKPRTVFVNSMSDLFHARVPVEFVDRVWATMEQTPQHTYQILTKRPERMARLLAGRRPLPNVWLGTSIESDEHVRRADALREVEAAVRFLSLEPLLGPLPSLDLTGIDWTIVGGESGPGARPMDLAWAADLRDRCARERVPFFMKQLGAVLARQKGCSDPKGHNPAEWPEPFPREYPHG